MRRFIVPALGVLLAVAVAGCVAAPETPDPLASATVASAAPTTATGSAAAGTDTPAAPGTRLSATAAATDTLTGASTPSPGATAPATATAIPTAIPTAPATPAATRSPAARPTPTPGTASYQPVAGELIWPNGAPPGVTAWITPIVPIPGTLVISARGPAGTICTPAVFFPDPKLVWRPSTQTLTGATVTWSFPLLTSTRTGSGLVNLSCTEGTTPYEGTGNFTIS